MVAPSVAKTYPVTTRDETISENYHGTVIKDPYRRFEDPDADTTKEFVQSQVKFFENYIQANTNRDQIRERLTKLWDFPRYGCPRKEGDRYFYKFNTGLQNQSVMYKQNELSQTEKGDVFMDPNALSDDGTIALRGESFSEDGSLFAYGLSTGGSDWSTIHFRDVATGKDLPDELGHVKFSCMTWTHDNLGLFYGRFPEEDGSAAGTATQKNVNQKLYYHKLGTPQCSDILCFDTPDHPQRMTSAEMSNCGNYVILATHEGCEPVNLLKIHDLKSAGGVIAGRLDYLDIVSELEAEFEYITNEGRLFTFKTNLNAPRYKLIQIDLGSPDRSCWRDLLAEHPQDTLKWATVCNGNQLVTCYMHDVKDILQVRDMEKADVKHTFGIELCEVVGFHGRKKHAELFFQITSFLSPGQIFRVDLKTGFEAKLFRQVEIEGFDPSAFTTEQIFYSSKDGTQVPMFIVHKKGLVRDGSAPCLLYGYGGFNISILPGFSVSRMMFLGHMGGCVAVANIRGGGEYGDSWHHAGVLGNKQNGFDDFQAAAEYLHKEKYTSSKKLVINGGSNGGLLVGACLNQRPDLFAGGIAQVGVLDMLRFHTFTIGHAWTTDYGCSDNADQFKWLVKYSPLHSIPAPSTIPRYPATLLVTADHDDRVVPSHSLKYIAELQHVFATADEQYGPCLIRVDTKSGHGFGRPTAKVIAELADIYCFIQLVVGATWAD